MTRTVICISHATGAGGHDVGRLVANRLGFRLVDEEIVARAAEKQGLSPADLADVERRRSLLERILQDVGRAGEAEAYVAFVGVMPEPQQDPGSLRALIRQSINETADEGKAVIVSHAASYALAGRPDVLRVLVTASEAARVRRFAETEGADEKKAQKAIHQNDAGRADYLKRFYGVHHELPTHYDLVVNTDALAPESVADLIAGAAAL